MALTINRGLQTVDKFVESEFACSFFIEKRFS